MTSMYPHPRYWMESLAARKKKGNNKSAGSNTSKKDNKKDNKKDKQENPAAASETKSVKNEATIQHSGNSHVNLNVNVDNSALAYAITSMLRASNTINDNQFQQILQNLNGLLGKQQALAPLVSDGQLIPSVEEPVVRNEVLGVTSAEEPISDDDTFQISNDVVIQDTEPVTQSTEADIPLETVQEFQNTGVRELQNEIFIHSDSSPKVTIVSEEDTCRRNTAGLLSDSSIITVDPLSPQAPVEFERENIPFETVPIFESERLSLEELESITDNIVVNGENEAMSPELRSRPQRKERKRTSSKSQSQNTHRTLRTFF